MRSCLIPIPLLALLYACGSQGTYRDFDGSYSWTNTQAFHEGYQELEYALDLAYNLVQASGSINPLGGDENWILPTLHQRITGTYRIRF